MDNRAADALDCTPSRTIRGVLFEPFLAAASHFVRADESASRCPVRRRPCRIQEADAYSGLPDSSRPRRPRCARPGPNRHRQDGTAAFLLPFFNRWKPGDAAVRRALVLAPTREGVATQIADEGGPAVAVDEAEVGGVHLRRPTHGRPDLAPDGRRLRPRRRHAWFCIASIISAAARLNFDSVKYVVLDEADPHARHRLPPRHRADPAAAVVHGNGRRCSCRPRCRPMC